MAAKSQRPKLMKASQWAKREFSDGSIPDRRTIRAWVMNGKVSGQIIDSNVYVYETETFGVRSEVSAAVMALISGSSRHGIQTA